MTKGLMVGTLLLTLASVAHAQDRGTFVAFAKLDTGDHHCSPAFAGQSTPMPPTSWTSPYPFPVYAYRVTTQWFIGGHLNPYAEGYNRVVHIRTGEELAAWGGEARWPDQTAITHWPIDDAPLEIRPGDTLVLSSSCAAYDPLFRQTLMRALARLNLYRGP